MSLEEISKRPGMYWAGPKKPNNKPKDKTVRKLDIGKSLKSSAFSSNTWDIITEAYDLRVKSSILYLLSNYSRRIGAGLLGSNKTETKEPTLDVLQETFNEMSKNNTFTCSLTKLKVPADHFAPKNVITKFDVNKNIITPHLEKALDVFMEGLPSYIDHRTGYIYKVTIPALETLISETPADTIVEFPGIGAFGVNTIDKDLVSYRDYNKFDEKISFKDVRDKESAYRFGLQSPSFRSTFGLTYTFGVEVECATSFVANNVKNIFNMSCVRDGSLNGGKGGPEYVTGVLTGDAGLMHLQKIVNYLSARSTIDKYCGIHVHVGGFVPSQEFSVAIFLLCHALQDDIFLTLPITRRSNEYCRLIPNNIIKKLAAQHKTNTIDKFVVNRIYDDIVEYVGALDLLGGKEQFLLSKAKDKNAPLGKYLNKNCNHPMGKKANYNHKTPRYEWINLVPLLFNEKGKDVFTIEFRPHPASLNFIKIKNWILLCMFITKYAETYASRIISNFLSGNLKPLTIEQVLEDICPLKIESASLSKYFNERKNKFDSSSKNLEKEEIKEYESESLTVVKDLKLKEICA